MSRTSAWQILVAGITLFLFSGCEPPRRPVQENIKRGWEAIEARNVNAAINYFNRAILLDHRNAEGYLGRAEAYRLGNEPQLSAADFARALQLDPRNKRAHALHGLNAYTQGNHQVALQSLSRAIDQGSRDANTYFYRAESYRALGHFELAQDDYARALAAQPDPAIRGQIEIRLGHAPAE